MEKELKISFEEMEGYNKLNEIEKTLFDKALEAKGKAYAIYSHFQVGCALLLENGEIITGSNQENAAYPSGLCAERTTIYWTSANHPNVRIMKLFVIGAPENEKPSFPTPPCGACRQAILEYEHKQNTPIEIYFGSETGKIYKTESIRSLLPFSFDGSFL